MKAQELHSFQWPERKIIKINSQKYQPQTIRKYSELAIFQEQI
jgi:hypothetical protein